LKLENTKVVLSKIYDYLLLFPVMLFSGEKQDSDKKQISNTHVKATVHAKLFQSKKTMTQTNRRQFIQQSGLFTLAAMTAGTGHTRETTPSINKPNVIFILADDLGYGDLGCYGQKEIQTPHLDHLAAEGMRFTSHYAGSTVCAPSRCALMTGKHTGHCTVRGNTDIRMKPDEVTLGRLFKQNGYATACIGKWGIGHPCPPDEPSGFGFDHFYGYLSMWHAHNYYTDFLWRNGEKVKVNNIVQHPETHYKEGERTKVGIATQRVEYSHDLFAEDSLRFIDANVDKPFFLYLALTIPHANNEAGKQGMEVPDLGIYQEKDWPEPQKGHAAMITRMDRDIGRILQKLKDTGLDNQTLVIFTSDNGPHAEGGADPAFNNSSGPLKGKKRDLYEGGIRVPMIARWPGTIAPGSTSDHPSAFWDYLPTFQELVGDKTTVETDGISLLPTLQGKTGQQNKHRYLYWEFHEQGKKQAVRMGRWKGVRIFNNGEAIELYDLSRDIGETQNLGAHHPDIVRKIEKIMKQAHTEEALWPLWKSPDSK
jgi:arylsulfatase A-like enzyme